MGPKEIPIAYLFWFLFGPMGGHKFYLGETGWGLLYFFTGGLFFVGWLVDLFTLPMQVRRANELFSPATDPPALPPLPVPEKELRSTFPLDETAVTKKALRQILLDPITWVPLVPAVAAYTIFDVPAVFSLGFGALVLGGVGAYWRQQWEGITARLRRDAIAEHNRLQDLLLKKSADDFQLAAENGFARKLEQFRIVKRKVEARLHEDGEITAQKIQLEQLIDSLCFGVRDQLESVLVREQKGEAVDRKAALAQVEEAFQTLQTTVAELDTILGPASPPGGATGASIEQITRRLREETEIARRVQARLREHDPDVLAPEIPRRETE